MENNIRINPTNYPHAECECGNIIWNVGYILKRIPGVAMGAGTEEQMLDLPVYYCSKCGKILPEYVKMYKLDEPNKKQEVTSSGLII